MITNGPQHVHIEGCCQFWSDPISCGKEYKSQCRTELFSVHKIFVTGSYFCYSQTRWLSYLQILHTENVDQIEVFHQELASGFLCVILLNVRVYLYLLPPKYCFLPNIWKYLERKVKQAHKVAYKINVQNVFSGISLFTAAVIFALL